MNYKAVVATIVGLSIAIPWALYYSGESPSERETYGRILVDSPEIYTRERMVNDRYDQEFWLRNSLEALDEASAHQPRSTRSFSKQKSNQLQMITTLSVNPITADDNWTGDPNQPAVKRSKDNLQNQGMPSQLGFIDDFRIRESYREEIRNRIIENQLDDRHDLGGSTLYRMKFDISIIPGSNTSAWGQASIKISNSIDDPQAEELELRELFGRWKKKLSVQVNEYYKQQLSSALADEHYQRIIWDGAIDDTRKFLVSDSAGNSRELSDFCRKRLLTNKSYSSKAYQCLKTALSLEKNCEEQRCEEDRIRELMLVHIMHKFGSDLGGNSIEFDSSIAESRSLKEKKKVPENRISTSMFEPFEPDHTETVSLSKLTEHSNSDQKIIDFEINSEQQRIRIREKISSVYAVPVEFNELDMSLHDGREMYAVPDQPSVTEIELFREYTDDVVPIAPDTLTTSDESRINEYLLNKTIYAVPKDIGESELSKFGEVHPAVLIKALPLDFTSEDITRTYGLEVTHMKANSTLADASPGLTRDLALFALGCIEYAILRVDEKQYLACSKDIPVLSEGYLEQVSVSGYTPIYIPPEKPVVVRQPGGAVYLEFFRGYSKERVKERWGDRLICLDNERILVQHGRRELYVCRSELEGWATGNLNHDSHTRGAIELTEDADLLTSKDGQPWLRPKHTVNRDRLRRAYFSMYMNCSESSAIAVRPGVNDSSFRICPDDLSYYFPSVFQSLNDPLLQGDDGIYQVDAKLSEGDNGEYVLIPIYGSEFAKKSWVEDMECLSDEFIRVNSNERVFLICPVDYEQFQDSSATSQAERTDPLPISATLQYDVDGMPILTAKISDDELRRRLLDKLDCSETRKVLVENRKFDVCTHSLQTLFEHLDGLDNRDEEKRLIELRNAVLHSDEKIGGMLRLVLPTGYFEFAKRVQEAGGSAHLYSYAVTPRESSEQHRIDTNHSYLNRLSTLSSSGVEKLSQKTGIDQLTLELELGGLLERRPLIVGIGTGESWTSQGLLDAL
jgi:hypothetical protein